MNIKCEYIVAFMNIARISSALSSNKFGTDKCSFKVKVMAEFLNFPHLLQHKLSSPITEIEKVIGI